MKQLLPALFIVLFALPVYAQSKIENLIVITTDGLRWQELFTGMDTALANNRRYNQGDSAELYQKYWHPEAVKRRERLMPFTWSQLVQQGQLFGNRNLGSQVNNANPYWFSYPGYSEIFTGYADTNINSNSYKPNPHITLLEFLHKQKAFSGKVAAFSAWEAFNRILNEKRAGFPVIAAFDTAVNIGPSQALFNNMLRDSYKPWHENECLDVFTHYAAFTYLKRNQPRVLYIAYGETDEWAHAGQYRNYLHATRQFDEWLKDIWNYIQSTPRYKNKTALFITTDHGRGDKVKEEWTSHGSQINGANEIWFAVIAPGLKGKGEMKGGPVYYQNQFAQTMASLLGIVYKADHPVADKIALE